jgi:hypothetical protein
MTVPDLFRFIRDCTGEAVRDAFDPRKTFG